MQATISKIIKHKELVSIGSLDVPHEKKLSPIEILNITGIQNAIRCLCCFEYKDYCLFLADVAESVLHIYESTVTDSHKSRSAIQAIRDFHAGNMSVEELKRKCEGCGENTYCPFASSAGCAAGFATGFNDACAILTCSCACASVSLDSYDAKKQKWQEIEQLFIKHFG